MRRITADDLPWIRDFWVGHWSGDFIVTRGRIHRWDEVGGFIAEMDGENVGLITYKIDAGELEVTSINSLVEKKGVGTALVDEVVNLARTKSLGRVMAITTNDDLDALKFWQKRGFKLVNIYPNAMEATRKLKPKLPLIGENGIPLRDEIELEMML
ncbi:MAG: hypothetical protein A2147_10315 [Chloroflexi bacterium RBG_16_57_8]|nr:MAG: hypothetical protein A2147_10315 [Chloroflexi bacterium RBG_16_57_8]